MNKVRLLFSIVASALLFLAGCAQPQPQQVIKQICLPQTAKAQAMQSAEDILTRMHFTINKSDFKQGYIRTRPLQAAQFFEFWRSDTIGQTNTTEANIHTIRRTAELNIIEKEQQLCIDCNVKVQRLSLFDLEGSSEAIARDRFPTSETISPRKKIAFYATQKAWIDLGNDDQLATVILNRLKEKLTEKQKLKMDEYGIPEYMHGGIIRYYENGISPG